MNSRREIEDAFDGKAGGELPPPAVFTQTGTVGQMEACGAHWPEACFQPGPMCELALQLSGMFGFATARVPFCGTSEVERLGAELSAGRADTQPSVLTSPYRLPFGVPDVPCDLMTPDEFADGGRCLVVAEAAGRISKEHPDLFVTAGMQDPVAVAMQLLGAENMMLGLMMEPEATRSWVRAMVPYCSAYARRLSEAADNVTVVALASCDLFDPGMFGSLAGSALPPVLSSISESYSTVHTCGDTLPVLRRLASLGEDGLSVEASRDPERFLDEAGGRCRMFGAVDPVGTLLSGSPEDVAAEARRSAELGFDVITPECGVAPRTPDANLAALAGYRGCGRMA